MILLIFQIKIDIVIYLMSNGLIITGKNAKKNKTIKRRKTKISIKCWKVILNINNNYWKNKS